jgi:hypothetical protein
MYNSFTQHAVIFLSFWDSGDCVSPVSNSNQMKCTYDSNFFVLWLIFGYEMNAVLASKLKNTVKHNYSFL